MRILLFSSLYPNDENQQHGIFVENCMRHLIRDTDTEVTVIAPVPWFPFRASVFGQYGSYARVPRHDERYGIKIYHPKFLVLPKIGMTLAPKTMAMAGLDCAKRLMAKGAAFDVICAQYFYPDGVAATKIGKKLGLPVTITALGSDINVIARYEKPRRMMLQASEDAGQMMAVSAALRNSMIDTGMPAEKISVLRNGIDLDVFHPVARDDARSSFNVSSNSTCIFVGNLVPLKRVDLIIEAVASVDGGTLLIAGDGPEKENLQALAARLGVTDRVRFLGRLAAGEVVRLCSAADALLLASESEGWPNVLLEAMACGTPVVAVDVGGVREIIKAPEAGIVVAERSASALATGLKRLFSNRPDRAATRRYAEGFSWHATSLAQRRIFDGLRR